MPDRPSDPSDSNLAREKQLNRLLELTLDLGATERQEFLKVHCPNETLREEVLELLEEDLGDFLETPSPSRPPSDSEHSTTSTALIYFGGRALSRGNYAQAADQLGLALQLRKQGDGSAPDLELAVLHRSLGKALAGLGRKPDAMEQIHRALQILRSLPASDRQHKELHATHLVLAHFAGFPDNEPPAQSVFDLIG